MKREKSYSILPAREKAEVIMAWLAEHKGRDIKAFDVSELSPVTEIMILVSGSSARHVRSLAEGVMELCVKENYEFLRMEGQQGGLWILADLNDVVIHLFQEHVRELYNLESLWRDAVPLR